MLRRLFCLCALAFLRAPLPAKIVAVLSNDSPALTQALAGVREAAPAVAKAGIADLPGALEGATAVVALGDAAAAAEYPDKLPVVQALAATAAGGLGPNMVRVAGLPDAFFLLGKIREILPRFDRLGMLVAGKVYDGYVKYIKSVGGITTTKVTARSVDDPAGLVEGLRDLVKDVDALWVAPDPLFMDAARYRLIHEFCLANKVALVAPVALMARNGGLVGISPSFRESGELAGEAAAKLESGGKAARTIQAENCDVLINAATAKALGFSVPAKAGTVVP